MGTSFCDGLPVYSSSYDGVKDSRSSCLTQSTGGSAEAPGVENYYMPSPTAHDNHISRQSISQLNNSSSNLLGSAINPAVANFPNPHQHLHSASSSSQGMLATPPSTTYEGEDLDHYSYHGSPTTGIEPLASSTANPSAPSPRDWTPMNSQQMGFQQQFLKSPETMMTYNFRSCLPVHHEQQGHSQVSSSPYQSQAFAPANPDADSMEHQEALPALAGLRNPDQAMTSQTASPLLQQEVGLSSLSSAGDSRRHSRTGQPNGEEGGKVDEPYAQLIHRAFLSREPHAMTLQEIYQWFRENTEKGKSQNKGWQNSIRHNLSMNRAFQKRDLKPIAGEPCNGVRVSKKISEWYLMPWAVNGVQSTTRYRTKGASRRRHATSNAHQCVNSSRRAVSGRKGGLTASKSKAKKASLDREQHHAAYHSNAHGGDIQLGNMILNSDIGYSYGVHNQMASPGHGHSDILMQHTQLPNAALPAPETPHGFAYSTPELPQYGQGSGSYHASTDMYSLGEVPSMYQGQQVTVPSHAGHGQGQGQQHSMGGIGTMYRENEELQQRRLGLPYQQGWHDSIPNNSYQQ